MICRNYIFISCVIFGMTLASAVAAQSRVILPAATTVPVVGESSVGTLIRYSDDTNRFEATQMVDDPMVYGVVAERPAVVFVTSSTSIPVVTSGTAVVKIREAARTLQVGDILTSATEAGYARVASTSDRYAFGFVSEVLSGDGDDLVSVVVDIDRARQMLSEARQNAVIENKEQSGWTVSVGRAMVAASVVLVGLIGIVVGTRVTLGKAITAVGRNPRARGTVFSLAGVTIVSAFALGLLTILVGVGILILPL